MMKLFLSICVLSVDLIHSNNVYAEKFISLDIGGIELRVGQKIDEALRLLSPYKVEFNNGSWFVTQKSGNAYQILGIISAENNVISFITKSFNMNSPEDLADVYTRASKELRRRGGTTCAIRELEVTNGLIIGFETKCGPYKLSVFMPSKINNIIHSASIDISVR